MTASGAERPDPYVVELALAAALAEVTDGQAEKIARAWAAAWAEVAGDLQDALEVVLADAGKVNTMAIVRYERLAKVLAAIADHLEQLVADLGVLVTEDLTEVLSMATHGSLDLITAQLPTHHRLPHRPVLPDALTAIVNRVTEQVTSTAQPVADETYAVIVRELTRGVAAGSSPRETARRMVDRAEDHYNFGQARAENIARTETLDAYREAARVQQDQHADILAGWVWLAHLGPRTCRSCLAMHGQVFDLDVEGPHDHPQGRCSRCPVVREADGTADLSWVPSADEHFTGLPRDQQVKLLGKRGFRAWLSGDFPREEWTKTRTADGWRPSQVPAAPGDANGGSGAGGDEPPTDGPERLLPVDEDFTYDGELRSQGPASPFTYTQLDALGIVAPEDDPHVHFSQAERAIATWLSEHGIEVRSVADADDIGRTPDAVFVGSLQTVEFKTLGSTRTTSIRNAAKEARHQSHRVLIDGRKVNLTSEQAKAGLARALGISGLDLLELALILGDSTGVGWSRV